MGLDHLCSCCFSAWFSRRRARVLEGMVAQFFTLHGGMGQSLSPMFSDDVCIQACNGMYNYVLFLDQWIVSYGDMCREKTCSLRLSLETGKTGAGKMMSTGRDFLWPSPCSLSGQPSAGSTDTFAFTVYPFCTVIWLVVWNIFYFSIYWE